MAIGLQWQQRTSIQDFACVGKRSKMTLLGRVFNQ